MPRKHLRSVESSYELEDDAATDPHGKASLDLGNGVGEGKFEDYDPSAYYLRASDENGHVINIQVTIPTNWGPALQQIIDSENNKYKNRVEIARDGLVHIMVRRLLESHWGDPEEAWFAETKMLELRDRVEGQRRYVDELERSFELHTEMENWSAILELCGQAIAVRLPQALRRRRDALVEKYRDRVPEKYHPSYEVE